MSNEFEYPIYTRCKICGRMFENHSLQDIERDRLVMEVSRYEQK